jgi:hypothetical protein
MAKKEINFLKGHEQEIRKSNRRLYVIKILSFSVIVLFILATAGVVGFNYKKKSELNSIEDKIDNVKTSITNLSSVETKQRYENNKLKAINPLLDKKKEHRLLINMIFSLLQEGVSDSDFKIKNKDQLKFEISSKDFIKIKDFFSNLKENEYDLLIIDAGIENFGFNEENKYFASVSLKLEKKEDNEN